MVHDFLKIYLPKQRNNSNHTIKAYRTSLEQLFDFVKKERNINLTQITFEILNDGIITEYLDDLESSRGCSISTRNHRLKCIRSFYNYAASMEPTTVIFQMEMRKIPFKKSPTSESISFMSENAVKALLDQPDTKTKNGLRNQFLMILMYDTAARVQEILNLQICDIHFGKTATATLLGKGNKVRTVPLMERTVQHFKNYIAIFHPEADIFSKTPLFYVERKGKVTTMSDDNIRKFIRYLLSCNVGEILTMIWTSILGLPLPLLPIQILWVNLVTDGLPAMALGIDPPEKDVMNRKPRGKNENVFSQGLGGKIIYRGVIISLVTLAAFIIVNLYSKSNLEMARTAAFATLVMSQLLFVFECRTEKAGIRWQSPLGNIHLTLSVVVSTGMLFAVIYIPLFQPIFQTVPLNKNILLLVLGLAGLGAII